MALASSFRTAFSIGVGCAAAIFVVVSLFLKEGPLRSTLDEPAAEVA